MHDRRIFTTRRLPLTELIRLRRKKGGEILERDKEEEWRVREGAAARGIKVIGSGRALP